MQLSLLNHSNFIFMCIFILCAFTGATSLNPILPSILLDSNAGESHLYWYGLIAAAFPFGQFFSAYALSYLSNSFNYRTIILYTSMATILTTFLCGIALYQAKLEWIILLRFITGLLEGNVVLLRKTIIDTTSHSQSRNKKLGIISTAITLGFLIGPILNGYIYTVDEIAGVFFPCGIACLMTCLALFFPRLSPNTETTKTDNKNTVTDNKAWKVWLLCIAIYFAADLFYQYIPLFLSLKFDLSVKQIAINLFLIALCNAIIAPFAFLAIKLFNYHFVLTVTAIAFIANIFLLSFVNSTLIPYVLCMQGAIIALLSNNLIYYFSDRDSPRTKPQHSNYLMSHIVSSRALVSGTTALTASYIAQSGLKLPFYLAIACIFLFLIVLRIV